MARRGRPPILNQDKRRQIVAILAVGGTRRLAASYVGCTPRTIRNTAARLPEFAEALRQAEMSTEVGYLDNILKASKDPKYWRAGAWALEHLFPERYAHRGHDIVTTEQVRRLMTQLCEILSEEVPDRYRKAVLHRLDQLIGADSPPEPHAADPNDADSSVGQTGLHEARSAES